MLSMIVAMDNNNLIGDSSAKNGLPWHYSEDLAFYKEKTVNKVNVMGRTTYELIGRPLPNRETYILTHNHDYKQAGCTVVNNIEEVLQIKSDNEIMIIGGVKVFEALFEHIERIYLTRINKSFTGDCYYDTLDLTKYEKVSSKQGQDPELLFEVYEKRN